MISKNNLVYFSFVLGCILTISITSTTVERLNTTIAENVQSSQNISNAKDLIKSAVDMETGARGFFINKNAEFLEPYYTGQGVFPGALDKLKNQSGISEGEKLRLDLAGKTHEQWVKKTQLLIDELTKDKSKNISELQSSLERKGLMDSFRLQMDSVIVEEESELKSSLSATERYQNYTRLVTYVSPIVAVFLIFFLTKMLERCGKEKDELVEIINKKTTVNKKPAYKKPATKKPTTKTRVSVSKKI